jgi:hypothetical protein
MSISGGPSDVILHARSLLLLTGSLNLIRGFDRLFRSLNLLLHTCL